MAPGVDGGFLLEVAGDVSRLRRRQQSQSLGDHVPTEECRKSSADPAALSLVRKPSWEPPIAVRKAPGVAGKSADSV
jgi:hypothetical protein